MFNSFLYGQHSSYISQCFRTSQIGESVTILSPVAPSLTNKQLHGAVTVLTRHPLWQDKVSHVSSWTQRPPVDLPLISSSCVSRKHHGCNFPILHESHVSCPWVQMGEFITCIHRFAYDSYTFCASFFLPIRLTFTYVVSKALYFYGPAIRRRSKFSRMVMEGQ